MSKTIEGVYIENPVGRPRAYDSPAQFNEAVDYYVDKCQIEGMPLTMTGLCLSMGFCGRTAMFDYATYPEFSNAVSRARLLVAHTYEMSAIRDKNATAARLLACIDNFWNPTIDIKSTLLTHEQSVDLLR